MQNLIFHELTKTSNQISNCRSPISIEQASYNIALILTLIEGIIHAHTLRQPSSLVHPKPDMDVTNVRMTLPSNTYSKIMLQ